MNLNVWADPAVVSNLHSWHEKCVYPCFHVVSKDCSEFSPFTVYDFVFDHHFDRLGVKSIVGCYRAGCEVAFFADDAVADVGKVTDVGVIHDYAVLDFAGISYSYSFAYAGVRSDVTVWSYVAFFFNTSGSFNVSS